MTPTTTLPYGRQSVDDGDIAAVEEVLRSDWLTQGPTVERFERALADRCGARHAVACSSGTAALHPAALAAGIEPGDRVITTPNTFVATVNCIRYAGGEPIFADIDPDTLNLDPGEAERALDYPAMARRVKGLIVTHFAGCPADLARLSALARKHGWFLIEDASHAFGARWRAPDGTWQRIGSSSHSEMTTFSFHPVKHLTTGEGGAVLTERDDLAERLRSLRTHGIVRDPARMDRNDGPWYHEMQELGFNYRITDMQCALGLRQLERLDDWIVRRGELVTRYRALLEDDPRVDLTREPEGVAPAWHLFTVQVPNRRRVYEQLRARGILVQVHYIPVHLQPYYRRRLGTRPGDFPNAEHYYERALSLPLFPAMQDDDVDRVVDELRRAIGSSGA